tara:strand:- start:15 stop:530 length:516 start_codon:yes stop_codon:yes gene_type:complete
MENTDLFKDKTYNGNLNIEKNKVSIDTNENFNYLEIHYMSKMNIEPIMNSNYVVKNDKLHKRIIIEKVSEGRDSVSDLFKYNGKAIIIKCILNKRINLYINKSNLELWNTLRKSEKKGSTDGTAQNWAYLTKDWENISFDGDNSKKSYIYRKTTYDKEKKTYTTIKEIRKK